MTDASQEFCGDYSGGSAKELISLADRYRSDWVVQAFGQAISQKWGREGADSLSDEENLVLAIEALENEVSNGGYSLFFMNSSCEYVPTIVQQLVEIGREELALLTQEAIDVLGKPTPKPDALPGIMEQDDAERDAKLWDCDDRFFSSAWALADPVLAYIRANEAAFTL